MAVNGVNRIIVAVRDLEKSKSYYAGLLGAHFYEANWTGEAFGIEVAISWNAGIELCAPIPGRERNCALTSFLDQRGEGIVNVVFNVDNADKALERAKAANIQTINALDYTQAEIDKHLSGLFSRYKEYFLNTGAQCGYGITLGQIEAKLK
jgi:catechol 2,3-dioxygenase-like lactoylglutathione lyase family enzyme